MTRTTPMCSKLSSIGFYLRCRPSLPTVCEQKQVETIGNPFMSKTPLTPEQLTQLIAGLNRLARNLWWTWNQESQEIFQELSPRGWQNLYHNAVAILHEVSDYELRVRLQDPEFAERVRHVLELFDSYLNEEST